MNTLKDPGNIRVSGALHSVWRRGWDFSYPSGAFQKTLELRACTRLMKKGFANVYQLCVPRKIKMRQFVTLLVRIAIRDYERHEGVGLVA